ncbi:MAG: hypothetical protein AAF217_12510 [Pseudomonadota bacterium]
MAQDQIVVAPDEVVDVVEKVTVRLKERILVELAGLENELDTGEGTTEHHLKMLTGFFKMVQGVDQMIDGIQQRHDRDQDDEIDIMEFRRELETQIARLVEAESTGALS